MSVFPMIVLAVTVLTVIVAMTVISVGVSTFTMIMRRATRNRRSISHRHFGLFILAVCPHADYYVCRSASGLWCYMKVLRSSFNTALCRGANLGSTLFFNPKKRI